MFLPGTTGNKTRIIDKNNCQLNLDDIYKLFDDIILYIVEGLENCK